MATQGTDKKQVQMETIYYHVVLVDDGAFMWDGLYADLDSAMQAAERQAHEVMMDDGYRVPWAGDIESFEGMDWAEPLGGVVVKVRKRTLTAEAESALGHPVPAAEMGELAAAMHQEFVLHLGDLIESATNTAGITLPTMDDGTYIAFEADALRRFIKAINET